MLIFKNCFRRRSRFSSKFFGVYLNNRFSALAYGKYHSAAAPLADFKDGKFSFDFKKLKVFYVALTVESVLVTLWFHCFHTVMDSLMSGRSAKKPQTIVSAVLCMKVIIWTCISKNKEVFSESFVWSNWEILARFCQLSNISLSRIKLSRSFAVFQGCLVVIFVLKFFILSYKSRWVFFAFLSKAFILETTGWIPESFLVIFGSASFCDA